MRASRKRLRRYGHTSVREAEEKDEQKAGSALLSNEGISPHGRSITAKRYKCIIQCRPWHGRAQDRPLCLVVMALGNDPPFALHCAKLTRNVTSPLKVRRIATFWLAKYNRNKIFCYSCFFKINSNSVMVLTSLLLLFHNLLYCQTISSLYWKPYVKMFTLKLVLSWDVTKRWTIDTIF